MAYQKKSQFYRLRRLCHCNEDYIEKALEMKQRFLERGYSKKCVDEAYCCVLTGIMTATRVCVGRKPQGKAMFKSRNSSAEMPVYF